MLLCRNHLLVAKRHRKLASHKVAGKKGKSTLVLKGHRKMLTIPPSLQDEASSQPKPATLWLANFLSRSATILRFLQSTGMPAGLGDFSAFAGRHSAASARRRPVARSNMMTSYE
jgi:hypothetical protein